MRAAVLTAPKTVELTTLPAPEPDAGEVLVRMRAVGLCGSDLGVWSGERRVPQTPWLMGHEGGGDIIAVGEGVAESRLGETVVVEPNYPCLSCSSCWTGKTSMCPNRDIVGINSPGLLAEMVTVPAHFAHRMPPEADSDAALAVLEPLTVARVATTIAAVPPGDNVLVAGAGSQGLLAVQLLVAQGAVPWVMERDPGRLDHAEHRGARNAADEGAPEHFHHVLDAVGSPGMWSAMLPKVAGPSTITVIGMSENPIPLTTQQITRGRMVIQGTIIYDHPKDFVSTINAVASGAVQPHKVLADPTPFSRTPEAFEAAQTAPRKTWIRFD